MANNTSGDPADPQGEQIVAALEIKVRRNGSMSVAGCIDHLPYALAMLDNAKESIRNYHARKRLQSKGEVIIPAKDTGIKI
jgi:hypothetical protein